MRNGLHLDFCSHEAAKYAVMRWHYCRRMPKSKLVRIGVWEDEKFSGAIIYGLGANRHLGCPFGLQGTEVSELVRVALAPGRRHPTSQVVAVSLKLLKRQSPGLRLVVSYADLGQDHIGTIYQAGGWFYLGYSEQGYLRIHGQVVHPRTVYDRYGPGGQSVPLAPGERGPQRRSGSRWRRSSATPSPWTRPCGASSPRRPCPTPRTRLK